MPELVNRLPKDSGENPLVFKADVGPADETLGMKYRTKEQTFVDAAKKILELEAKLKV
jgi:hypothetical protein